MPYHTNFGNPFRIPWLMKTLAKTPNLLSTLSKKHMQFPHHYDLARAPILTT
jgi:hypothetical protein